MSTRGGVAAVILAAGSGTRFGGRKVLARLDGEALATRACRTALASAIGPVLCVVGADGAAVSAVLPEAVHVVVNARWASGLATSLAAAVAELEARGEIGAVCVGLADQPLVGPAAYRRVADAFTDGAELAVATYGGRRGHPVLIARTLWSEVVALEGDAGARQLMDRFTVTPVECDGTGEPIDVDTPEDLVAVERGQVWH